MRLQHVLSAVQATPWAILPEKFAEIMSLLELRAGGQRLTRSEIRARIGAGPRRDPYAAGTVAVLPIHGVIAHRMDAMMEMSGGTSTEQLARKFDALLADPSIAAIVLDVDSPGGAVDGTPELAQHILASRGQKPIVAISNGLMASAAYYIASAADEIVLSPSSLTGSIGVIAAHVDASKLYEDAGLKVTLISAGKYKTEGTDTEPLPDEARAHLQEMVDDAYDQFVKAVARHRGVGVDEVRGGFGEGRVLTAKRALKAGLGDRIATLDQVTSELVAGKGRRSGRAAVATLITPSVAERLTNRIAAAALPGGTLTATTNLAGVARTLVTPASEDAEEALEPILAAAPVAKEQAMPEKDTAAHPENGAAPTTPAPSAQLTRESALDELAEAHNVSVADLNRWKRDGLSVKQASKEILAAHAERGHQVPTAAPAPITRVTGVHDRAEDRPWVQGTSREALRAGATDFLMAVKHAGMPGAERIDPRLRAAASGMSQGVPQDGGFAVFPEYSSLIWDRMNQAADNLLGRTDSYTVTGESIEFLANAETSRANGSRWGGVRGYWINEADQITKSKPTLRKVRVEPQQMAVLVYLTEKLLNNSPVALEQYVTRAAADEINFVTGDAIVNGTGAGQPKGIMGSGCLVTVTKETSQPSATFNKKNANKMWSRLHPAARANAIWLYNVDVEPQFDEFFTAVTNVAGTENVGGIGSMIYNADRQTLKGRPLVPCEFCATLGTKGDVILTDLQAYLTGVRGGLQSAASMHVRFEYAEMAFRFMYECDGQPWLASAITPYKGTNTLSAFVVIENR